MPDAWHVVAVVWLFGALPTMVAVSAIPSRHGPIAHFVGDTVLVTFWPALWAFVFWSRLRRA